ncbi:MAG: hypothetical protein ABIK97_06580 [candidate division WOR-3 bacterium]
MKRKISFKKELNCQDVKAIIFEYFDKEIKEELLYQIERHRMSCLECTRLIRSYRLLINVLKAIEEKEVPEEVHRRLLRRMEEMSDD